VRLTVPVCVTDPPVPMTPSVYVPGDVAPVGVIVSVDAPEPPVIVTLGLNVAVAPVGTPITLSATFEFKLPCGMMLTEYTAIPPAESEMLCDVGEIEPMKSGVTNGL